MKAEKSLSSLKELLDFYYDKYNRPSFIEDDPISVPHRFANRQDIEIAGFWTAILSWGRRKTIIDKANQLMELMDESPYDFIVNHQKHERKRFSKFVHRTFQYTDTLYFLHFFQEFYRNHQTLEEAFLEDDVVFGTAGDALNRFHEQFFSLPDAPARTRKHVSTPARKSTCKRLNMFLRWMVRDDNRGVDFGLWKRIEPHQLHIPLDLHVDRVARGLGMLQRRQTDWQAVRELTDLLSTFDPNDPVKYDFALFGIGVLEPDEMTRQLKP